MLAEGGSVSVGIEIGAAKLPEEDISTVGKVGIEEPVSFGDPFVVAGVWGGSLGISPAGRFSDNGPVDEGRETLVALGGQFRGERSTIEEMLAGVVGELKPEFGIGPELGIKARGFVGLIHASPVVPADTFKSALGVPVDELVSSAIDAWIDGVPVVVVPVAIAAVKIDEHVVDEVRDIDIL